MTFFFAVLLVALIGGVAVVLGGRGGDYAMAEEYDDRPDVRVQADGPLTGADLRDIRFTTAVRGYRASEVDALLDRLAAQLDHPVDPSVPRGAVQTDPEDAPGPDGSADSALPDWRRPRTWDAPEADI